MSTERSKGRFLADWQREYLHGKREPETKNSRYATESQIRARIKGALFELKVFNQEVDDRVLKKLFEDWESDPDQHPESGETYTIELPQQLAEIQAIIEMAYRGYRLNGMDADEFVNSVVENAIRQAEAERNDVHANKNISIDLELNNLEVHTDYDELSPVEKFDKGLPLTWDEQMQLYDEISDKLDRDISVDEAGELIEKHLIESSNQSEN
jgi:hypothetical protein